MINFCYILDRDLDGLDEADEELTSNMVSLYL